MSTIDLGIVYEPHPRELAELDDALVEITGAQPSREHVVGYAGPNEVVQILIDAATWKNALSSLAALFGGTFAISFANELGKQVASEVWKEKKNYYEAVKQASANSFLRVVAAIQALRAKEQTVTIAVRVPGTPRNAGLVLTSNDPAEIAWQISNVTRCSVEIVEVIQQAQAANPGQPPRNGNNPDLSIVIEVLDNGDVRVLGAVISK